MCALLVLAVCGCSKNNNDGGGSLDFPMPPGGSGESNVTVQSGDGAGTGSETKSETGTDNNGDTAVKDDGAEKSDGYITLQDGDSWNLILVNPWNTLPEDFDVDLTQLKNGHYVDTRAYPDLQQMMDDMRADGLSPVICSSYRTLEKQTTLFTNKVNKYISGGYSKAEAEAEAAKWVAVPGTSEHHTGLALDIVAQSYQLLDEKQADTAEQKWLMKNSYKYGFILRYPNDKTEITGIYYEPWHYRYVGKETAKEIYDAGICLEEYLGRVHGR